MIEKQLFEAYQGRTQIVAIPLKHQEDSTLNPQPNFLVIDNIFDYRKVPLTLPTGQTVETECRQVNMRVVYREVLPEQYDREEDIREVTFDHVGEIWIPYVYESFLRNQETLIINEEVINEWMTLFQFRGFLEGFKMEYDKNKSEKYLEIS